MSKNLKSAYKLSLKLQTVDDDEFLMDYENIPDIDDQEMYICLCLLKKNFNKNTTGDTLKVYIYSKCYIN